MIFAATGAQLRCTMFHVKHAASGLNPKKIHSKLKLAKAIIKLHC